MSTAFLVSRTLFDTITAATFATIAPHNGIDYAEVDGTIYGALQ